MAVFFVNGTEVTVEKNQRLLRYLRDTLHLTHPRLHTVHRFAGGPSRHHRRGSDG